MNNNGSLAYISGPYRADTLYGVAENIRKAEAVAIKFWKLGYGVITPHKNTAFMDGVVDDVMWILGDCEMIRRFRPDYGDIVVMMPDWEKSKGAKIEHELAKSLGLEIVYEQ